MACSVLALSAASTWAALLFHRDSESRSPSGLYLESPPRQICCPRRLWHRLRFSYPRNPITNLHFSPPFVNTVTVLEFSAATASPISSPALLPRRAAATAAIGNFDPTQTDFGAFSPVDQHLDDPRNQRVERRHIEYQALANLVLKVSYIGTHNDHLQVSVPINLVELRNFPAPPTDLGRRHCGIPERVSTAKSVAHFGPINLNDPRFDNVTQVKSTEHRPYNALRLEAVRRFHNGLTLDTNYTSAHSLDDLSDALEDFDQRQRRPARCLQAAFFAIAPTLSCITNRASSSLRYKFPSASVSTDGAVLDGWSQRYLLLSIRFARHCLCPRPSLASATCFSTARTLATPPSTLLSTETLRAPSRAFLHRLHRAHRLARQRTAATSTTAQRQNQYAWPA